MSPVYKAKSSLMVYFQGGILFRLAVGSNKVWHHNVHKHAVVKCENALASIVTLVAPLIEPLAWCARGPVFDSCPRHFHTYNKLPWFHRTEYKPCRSCISSDYTYIYYYGCAHTYTEKIYRENIPYAKHWCKGIVTHFHKWQACRHGNTQRDKVAQCTK